MTNKPRKRSRLSQRPPVRELRNAEGKDKAVALVGMGLVLVLGIIWFVFLKDTGALAARGTSAAGLTAPSLGVRGGILAALVGLLFLALGWPLYRLTVILSGLMLGASLAGGIGWLAAEEPGCMAGAVIGGLVGALLAWPLEVLIRSLTGAAVGMGLGLFLGSMVGGGPMLALAGLGGLLLGGALTFLLLRPLVMTYFALSGALLVVYGIASVMTPAGDIQVSPWMPGVAAGLVVAGLFLQRSLARKADRAEARSPG